MISAFWIKVIGFGAAAMLLVVLVMDRNAKAALAKSRGERLELICSAVRDAAGNPKMKCGDAARQINPLGRSVADTKAALDRQNKAVNGMAAASAKAQHQAEKAISLSKERIQAAETTADRLRASATRKGAENGASRACEPSDELRRAWR